jgi:hypothetical protein
MSIDEWELLSLEFDRLLKEATDNGMTVGEFHERMTRLQWEFEELRETNKKNEDEQSC